MCGLDLCHLKGERGPQGSRGQPGNDGPKGAKVRLGFFAPMHRCCQLNYDVSQKEIEKISFPF